MNLFKQGISKDATDSATLGINTRSFEVSNMSQYDLQINDPILNGYRLPAYASKTFEATPGMTIDFQLVAPVVNTNGTTSTQYVQIAESPVSVVTPVTPLALIPIYNLPITGTVNADITNANVPVSGSVTVSSGTVNATIQNASVPVSGSVNATIQNASVPVSGSVSVSSGSVNATIQNAQISTQVVNTSSSPVQTEHIAATTATSGTIVLNANGSGVVIGGSSLPTCKKLIITPGVQSGNIPAGLTFDFYHGNPASGGVFLFTKSYLNGLTNPMGSGGALFEDNFFEVDLYPGIPLPNGLYCKIGNAGTSTAQFTVEALAII